MTRPLLLRGCPGFHRDPNSRFGRSPAGRGMEGRRGVSRGSQVGVHLARHRRWGEAPGQPPGPWAAQSGRTLSPSVQAACEGRVCVGSRLCSWHLTSVEVVERYVAMRGPVNSRSAAASSPPRGERTHAGPRRVPSSGDTESPSFVGARNSAAERIRTSEQCCVGAQLGRTGLDPARLRPRRVTRMWVTKVITTDHAEQAGRWLRSRWSKGLEGASLGGEDGWKHHWASDANREPTRSVPHLGGGRAFGERCFGRPLGRQGRWEARVPRGSGRGRRQGCSLTTRWLQRRMRGALSTVGDVSLAMRSTVRRTGPRRSRGDVHDG